jgi:hypothetical protein
MLKKVTSLRFVVGVVASFAIAGGAYAFTASNTVPTSNVGAGAGTVSGYTVTNLHYSLNSTTPSNIDSLTFNVSPSIPSTGTGKVSVSAALTTGGPNAYSCTTNTAGDTVTCATTAPQLTADKLSSVTVVAAQ